MHEHVYNKNSECRSQINTSYRTTTIESLARLVVVFLYFVLFWYFNIYTKSIFTVSLSKFARFKMLKPQQKSASYTQCLLIQISLQTFSLPQRNGANVKHLVTIYRNFLCYCTSYLFADVCYFWRSENISLNVVATQKFIYCCRNKLYGVRRLRKRFFLRF